MMKVEYSSNNSGGNWWLKDEDWAALEKAGWVVEWFKNQECVFKDSDGIRWLGALAKNASKEFTSVKEALQEFEKITGQNVSDEGCHCCGAPHSFNWEDENGNYDYCSGEGCLAYLYNKVPSSLREAVELLNSRGK